MPPARDPLSVRYDTTVRKALVQAIRSGPPREAARFVASPGGFGKVDRGGRTAHERAFTRAAYYHVRYVPRLRGVPPVWSLKLSWGPVVRTRGGRYGRVVVLRLYRYGSGYSHAAKLPGRSQWTAGGFRSEAGRRVDD